jgi:hypothetical protein
MARKTPRKTRSRAPKGDEIKIRVTPEDKRVFGEAAQRRGLSMSAWLRMVALDAARAASPLP